MRVSLETYSVLKRPSAGASPWQHDHLVISGLMVARGHALAIWFDALAQTSLSAV